MIRNRHLPFPPGAAGGQSPGKSGSLAQHRGLVTRNPSACDTGVIVRALAKPGSTAACGFLVRPSDWLADLASDPGLTASATLLAALELSGKARRAAPAWTTMVEFGQASILDIQTVRNFGFLLRSQPGQGQQVTLIVDISEVLANPLQAIEHIAVLKTMGFCICLDGVDPLAPHSLLLERLAIDMVRIDFRDRPTPQHDPDPAAWPEKLMDLAYFLNNILIKTVAAGIRDSHEVELADVAGCSMHHGPRAGRQLSMAHAMTLVPSDLET